MNFIRYKLADRGSILVTGGDARAATWLLHQDDDSAGLTTGDVTAGRATGAPTANTGSSGRCSSMGTWPAGDRKGPIGGRIFGRSYDARETTGRGNYLPAVQLGTDTGGP